MLCEYYSFTEFLFIFGNSSSCKKNSCKPFVSVLAGRKSFVLNPALTASELILCSVPIAFFS